MVERLLILITLALSGVWFAADTRCPCASGACAPLVDAQSTACCDKPALETESACCNGCGDAESAAPTIADESSRCSDPLSCGVGSFAGVRRCDRCTCNAPPRVVLLPLVPTLGPLKGFGLSCEIVHRCSVPSSPVQALPAPYSWLARQPDATARRAALCSWTT